MLIGVDVSAVTAFSYAWRNLVLRGRRDVLLDAMNDAVTRDLFQLRGAWKVMRVLEKKKKTKENNTEIELHPKWELWWKSLAPISAA